MDLKEYIKEEINSFGLPDMNGYKVAIISKLSRLPDLPIFLSKVFEDEKVVCIDMRPYEAKYKTPPTTLKDLIVVASEWKLPIIDAYLKTGKFDKKYPSEILKIAQLAFVKPVVDKLTLNQYDASIVNSVFLYPMAKELTDEPKRLIAISSLYSYGSDTIDKISSIYGNDGYEKFNMVIRSMENITFRLKNLQLSDVLQFGSKSVFRMHLSILQESIKTPLNLLDLGVLYTNAIRYKKTMLFKNIFLFNKKYKDLSETLNMIAEEIEDYLIA